MSSPKAKGFTEKLQKDLGTIYETEVPDEVAKFDYVVLLDDFTVVIDKHYEEFLGDGLSALNAL